VWQFVGVVANGRGTFIVPIRRGMLVMPVEVEWIIKRGAADATSASLRRADLTSRSLQIRWSTFTPASDGISAHKQEADQEGS